ncbi:family 1 glycosylhydrolase [Deinococcus peraridilitoris]|uniref:dTDP-4-dehydrorhamnose reductase n=1 Tax=Deinococcus peraridilitoris (strain DSM 19664 / LMG 22246 / CIP 109416 / KR-200) TaxID=937777 RepID=K9ZXY6_DEIPD|nr:family 1 glycosylhydrolase [Deinococcus peraridilitoris]AFZ66466.1 dTDP-4-dehydrorhamnose reductase [Deinococcus peraridilitoris DSM 19664]
MTSLELWVGVEATVNRVGEIYHDQMERSGFERRLDDLDRIAELGARSMRFPVLWEKVAPEREDKLDWQWPDARLARLRELNVNPVVGLLHHGSGPRYTDLVDPEFPQKLARYARRVAERYPWVRDYTPVNEPVTTARFSGLYGHWYPHGKSDGCFIRTLLNEIHGTVLAMRAIREINPAARLVQTEDVGFTHSTEMLRYQADFENIRRWLSFDLLTGKVDEHHPLWYYLRHHGASEEELLSLVAEPYPPDILGINVYATSERFLDERLERYPVQTHGGNERHAYADVEAVRVLGEGVGIFEARLRDTHERYGLPIAVTEAHLGCTREEQMRWLHEAWNTTQAARDNGVDVRALTVWAAFGSFDWNTLVTQSTGFYEPSLWDIRSPTPRPTGIAKLARQLALGEGPHHPVVETPGWWRREDRFNCPVEGEPCFLPLVGRPLLITGASGTLGRAFARLCEVRGLPYHLLSRAEMDITDPTSIARALAQFGPWAVVNTAGYVRVDDAEHDERNMQQNAFGAANLAAACAERGVPLLTFSSDLVFDGRKNSPYVESDPVQPLNAYGRSKMEAERAVLAASPESLVIRTAAFFGPWDEHNFVTQALRAVRHGEMWCAADDQVVSPTFVPHLVNHSLDLLIDEERGVWHLANAGAVSWADFARMAVERAGLDVRLVQGVPGAVLGQLARRPAYSVLGSERGWIMPSLERALDAYFGERRETQRALVEAD